jgi:tetratricopeptide (TPR) repeat protein
MARFAEIPGNGAAAFTSRGFLVAEAGMERLDSSRRAALGWVDRAQTHRELGLAAFARAQSSLTPAEARPALLEEARSQFRRALTLAPIDPQVLAMLTGVEMGLGHRQEALDVLAMAYAVAPVSPEFALIRSWVAMRLWPQLSPEQQTRARADFVMALKMRPRQLVMLARGTGFVPQIRESIVDDFELSDAFEDMLTASFVYPQQPPTQRR